MMPQKRWSYADLFDRRLLLRQAVKRAQPPDQFAAVDADHASIRKTVAQD
jgi:hypothetical protein